MWVERSLPVAGQKLASLSDPAYELHVKGSSFSSTLLSYYLPTVHDHCRNWKVHVIC
jgi:hypothetical protein